MRCARLLCSVALLAACSDASRLDPANAHADDPWASAPSSGSKGSAAPASEPDAAQLKAQDLLATTMLSPETQVLFNIQKGSMPVRTDVDASKFDSCAQKGMKLLADPSHQTPVVDLLLTADLSGTLDDVITNFLNNKSATVDDFIAKFTEAMKAAN